MSYPRQYYREDNPQLLCSVIKNNPLATLNIIQAQKIQTAFLPLTISEDQTHLLGHATKDNPIFQTRGPIQATFHCDDHYLSPAVVPDIKLPTWLYANVIVMGELVLISDDEEKYQSMQAQLHHFEQFSHSDWQLNNVPAKQRQSMFNAINFFRINIVLMEGAFKLSQNQSQEVRSQICKNLKRSENKLAFLMR
ncbi:FMN-binding negative transcriptional regulator [Pseudoalteromonas piscicida]|uniref:Transcriptional regulator n=1 Tax=Pseudoalteromonas piscicida TaxID=43662 RepID=A0A2A5JUK7_PSEO7|nr:FMN-binding negative transcriptional regulator [Pseudoalteromonas piscicida]PCK33046.1 transcriptional regulator [Pseudoalteromonas piscicida]